MASKIQFVEAENSTREYPNAFIVDEAMFKVNGEYVCVEPCGGGAGHLLDDQYIYVSSDGDDGSAEGLIETPFKTINGAMNYINQIVTLRGDLFLVFMDEGPFYLEETLKINHVNKIHWVGAELEIPDDSVWWGPTLMFLGGIIEIPSSSSSSSSSSSMSMSGGGHITIGGGTQESEIRAIQTVDTLTETQTSFFGNLSTAMSHTSACSDGLRAFAFGGSTDRSEYNYIQYVTFATSSNSTSWGFLYAAKYGTAACSNGTIGMISGGTGFGNIFTLCETITFTTEGNSVAHGDLVDGRYNHSGCNNRTIALFASGNNINSTEISEMESVTFDSEVTVSAFGHLDRETELNHGTGNEVMGIFFGGLNDANGGAVGDMEYVMYATESHGNEWGDVLRTFRGGGGGTSDGTNAYLGGGFTFSSPDQQIQSFAMVIGSSVSSWGSLLEPTKNLSATSGA